MPPQAVDQCDIAQQLTLRTWGSISTPKTVPSGATARDIMYEALPRPHATSKMVSPRLSPPSAMVRRTSAICGRAVCNNGSRYEMSAHSS
jgi:hypothetical protein